MEKILQWVVRLEEKLDQLDTTVSDDLKIIKEQFQNHEVNALEVRHERIAIVCRIS